MERRHCAAAWRSKNRPLAKVSFSDSEKGAQEMYAVEVYAAVRRFVFVEGRSRREAARVFGLSRDTIQKICTFSAPPGYQRTKPPARPRLDPFISVIDAILESDKV